MATVPSPKKLVHEVTETPSLSLSFPQMPSYSTKDKDLIEDLRENYGWGAKRIVKEFPTKPWTVSGVSRVLLVLRETGSTNRVKGSGKRSRTPQLIQAVMKRALSDESDPGTHMSQRRIAAELQVSRSTVQRVIKQDLKLSVFKRFVVQSLTNNDRTKRLERCNALLNRFPNEGSVRRIWFSDEKIFTVSPPVNRQNSRIYGREQGTRKRELSPERLLLERRHFSARVMVSIAFSAMGRTRVFFVEDGHTVVSEYYTDRMLPFLFQDIQEVCGGNWVWQQDGATAHTSRHTVSFLHENCPSFIPPEQWPPHSPDLNPVDYFFWGAMIEKVYSKPPANIEELKVRIVEAATAISQRALQRAVAQWRTRLQAVVERGGGHIEHLVL
jgi:inhibitor of nuclear factor kappa-B kinase subunit alpha